MQPWVQDLLRAGAAPAALALVALVIVFALIRPALKAATGAAADRAAEHQGLASSTPWWTTTNSCRPWKVPTAGS
jgi:hypothetical protein